MYFQFIIWPELLDHFSYHVIYCLYIPLASYFQIFLYRVPFVTPKLHGLLLPFTQCF